jgi:glycosyltransferase involved in cell wall biosynthesis
MRVLFIPTPDLAYESGSTLFVRSILRGLARRGWQADVLCQTVPDERIEGVRFHRLPLPLDYQVIVDRRVASEELFDSFSVYLAALRASSPERFDVVHSVYATFTGLAACAATWFWNVPHVVTTFGRDIHVGASFDPRYRNMIRATFAAAHHVTVPTAAIAGHVTAQYGVPASSVTVLPSGVDLRAIAAAPARAAARAQLEIPPDTLLCLTVQSSFSADKGLDVLLRAFPRLCASRPDAMLVVIGRDDLPDRSRDALYRSMVLEAGVAERTRFVGQVRHSMIPTWLAAADLFVDPRRSGNFSTSLLEAIAAGVPVVASDLPANLDLLDEEQNGRAFASGSHQALGHRLVEISSESFAGISQRQKAWMDRNRQVYSFDALAERLDGTYRRLG